MEILNVTFLSSAFVAGFLMFLAPCTFPLVPGYIGFVSGVSKKDLEDKASRKLLQKKIFKNGVFFVLGFSTTFILLGALAGILGSALIKYHEMLSLVSGVFIIFLGLFMLGVFDIYFLKKVYNMKFPKFLTAGKPTTSFLVGLAFAIGWTPCVGPILGAILTLATSSATVLQGTVLLTFFSAGFALPFLFVAATFGYASMYVQKISQYMRVTSFIGGIFLVLLGLVLVNNEFAFLMQYWYQLFQFG